MTNLLIKNGNIVTSTKRFISDIFIEKGKIKQIAPSIENKADRILDASGHFVFPGAVDVHVHLDLPAGGTFSADNFESGSKAALFGGTTSIIDFVTPEKDQSLIDALNERKKVAQSSIIDYGFHMSITDYGDDTPVEMAKCVREEGISSFKIYLAYKEAIGLEDKDIIQVMKSASALGAMITAHCEHGDLVTQLRNDFFEQGKTQPIYHSKSRPAIVEAEATHRATVMALLMNVPIYIVHVSCQESAAAIQALKKQGANVIGETCPQYLLLDDSVYHQDTLDAIGYVMSPPIRPKNNQDHLWQAIEDGTLQVVATDHCPFNKRGQKDKGLNDFRSIPNGAPGIEDRLSLIYTYGVTKQRININKMVDLLSTRPAQLFGLYPQKGCIAVGSDADLVIWNPETSGIIKADKSHHQVDYSIFEGFQVSGAPTWVIKNGAVCIEQDQLMAEIGSGQYLKRQLPDF